MIEARTGNTLSSHSHEAAMLYNEAIDLILGSQSGASQALNKALELDPHFALAAAARYLAEKDSHGSRAQNFRTLAKESADAATDWEREHIDVLFGLIEDAGNTWQTAQAYIERIPRDLLIVSQLSSYLIFYGGPNKLNAVLSLLESIEPDLEHDWAYLARLGFAASEAGDHRRGRELIERALKLRPQSLYSVHAMAHLLHDEGAAAESTHMLQNWLSDHEQGAREGQLYGHIQWHLALSEWQTGACDEAMKRYEAYSAPKTTTCGPTLALADCGGLLLRQYLASGQRKPLTEGVLELIERIWTSIGHPFIALHVAGLYASAGDIDGLKKCRETITASSPGTNRDIALALVSALDDFAAGDYARCAQTLAALSPEARIGIGGSNVERILIDLVEESAKARL